MITEISREQANALTDVFIGLLPQPSAESALAKAEHACLEANRLTAPERGIETRDTVVRELDGSFKTIVFEIVSE